MSDIIFILDKYNYKIKYVCKSYNIPVAKKKYAIFIGTIPQFICLDTAATQSVRGVEPLASLLFTIFTIDVFEFWYKLRLFLQSD